MAELVRDREGGELMILADGMTLEQADRLPENDLIELNDGHAWIPVKRVMYVLDYLMSY